MTSYDPDKDFSRVVVVETGKSRFIGIQRELVDRSDLNLIDFILDQAVGLTIQQVGPGQAAPAMASLDYNRYAIDGLTIKDAAWFYHPCDQDEKSTNQFKAAYFTMLEQMRKERESMHRADIQPASADTMKALDQLARGGKLPPGIIPGVR